MSDKLSFLGGEEPSEVVAAPEEAAPVEQSAQDGPARGPDGKFVARASEGQPEPQAAPEAAPASPQPVQAPEPAHAPLTALLDEREKRQAAERQLAELQRQLQQRQAPAAPPPDRWEDPDGFDAWQQQQLDNRFRQMRAQMSERLAQRQYGPELVATVRQWAEQKASVDPFFAAQAREHEDPYEFAIGLYNRERVLTEVTPADLEAFRAWKAGQPAPAPQGAPQQSVAPPPRSLASATSAGGAAHIPVGEGQAFDALFRK